MSNNNQDPPIVISGGSVTIAFDQSLFTKNGNGKLTNSAKKISSVEVAVEGQTPQTFEVPDGKVTVTINFGNGK